MEKVSLCFVFIFVLFFSINSYSQEDKYKDCLKRTSVSVYKAQKQMIANNSTQVQGKLAQAILLQRNAIKYYEENNKSLSICYTLLARQYALEVIQSLSATGKIDSYYQISTEEQQMTENCLSKDQSLKQGKTNFPNYSENDTDYLNPSLLKNYIEVK